MRGLNNIMSKLSFRALNLKILLSFLVVVASLDDGVEGWLEGSTTNEETIDIRLIDKFSGIGIGD